MKKYLLTYFALAIALSVWAQERTVTGKVTSAEDGNSLPGVNVIVKGSTNGTVTDTEGKYSLVVQENVVLIFSFIGLKTQEVSVGTRSVVDVPMTTDVTQLTEVVVTGTGVATDKRRLGISVESISSDKLPTIPTASIDQALVGKIAGAQIFSTSGQPGSKVSIQLRGANTLLGGTNPLIMVDGVEVSSTSLNNLDLSNVERIEVVQGAASATIYGAQGANGVIQIFTKKGKEGAIRVDVSGRISFDTPLNIGDVHQPFNHSFVTDANGSIMDTDEENKKLTQNEVGIWGATTWLSGPTVQNNTPYKDNTRYYDHVDQLFRTAITQNYNVGISGGTAKTDYSFSVSKNIQESVISGKLDRNNFSFNIGTELFKNFKMRFTNQFVYSNNTTGTTGIAAAMYTYPFADFTYLDPDGNHTYKFGGAGANSTNPLYTFQYQTYANKTLDVIPSINFTYKVGKFLELDYRYGINHSRADYERFTYNQEGNKSSAAGGYFEGQSPAGDIVDVVTRNTNQNSLISGNLNIDFAKDFGWNFPIISTTLGRFDWRKYAFDRTVSNYIGLPQYGPVNGAQGNANNSRPIKDEFITYGFVVNQKFEYKSIAGVSGGVRGDYASTYGEASKPFYFPRGDVYFRLSELGVWSPLKSVVSDLKLRAAYGEAGTQPVLYRQLTTDVTASGGAYPDHYLRINTLNSGSFDNGAYLGVPNDARNPGIKVERSKEFEYGIDLGITPGISENILTDVSLNLTVWDRKGTDVLWAQGTSPSQGIVQFYTNYIDLSSKGVQFSLDAQLYEGANFGWNLLTMFGQSTSMVDRTLDGKDVPLPWSSAATYTLRPGEKMGTIYGYRAITSIDQKAADGTYYLDQSNPGAYEVVNGIVVNRATKAAQFTPDKQPLGNTQPKFNMSFTNNFHYKDFLTFSFQLDWVKQKTYNQTKEWMYSEGLHGDYDKPVTINGETGNWVAYYKSFYDAIESNGTKDFFFENSSFLRLRNVSLAFDFDKLFNIPSLSRLQIVLTGRNLWTKTKYTGFDPEANQNTSGEGTGTGAGQVSAQRGLDYWSFPNFKSYQIGLNVGL